MWSAWLASPLFLDAGVAVVRLPYGASRFSICTILSPALLSTKCHAFWHICMIFSARRGSFLVLLAAGHLGGPSAHYNARVGPVRASWRVLWMFIVAPASKFNRGRVSSLHGRVGAMKSLFMLLLSFVFALLLSSQLLYHALLQAMYVW